MSFMAAAGSLFYLLHIFELAIRGICAKQTKTLRRGLAAMKALKAWCASALNPATPS